MKKIIFICTLLTICTVFTKQSKAQKTTRAKVMILGSYHMGNPGMDLVNMKADDVLAPNRQNEIEHLVNMIAKFNPTKIAVEVSYQLDSLNNTNYDKYINGDYLLKRNESEQIGFRLGKKLNHKKIYAIDVSGRFAFNKLMEFAQKNGQAEELNKKLTMVKEHLNSQNEKLPKTSISAFIKEMNNPKTHKMSHNWHLDLLKFKKGNEYAGAQLLTDLYERNLKIVANLIEITENENDRILVIYGNGHANFIKSILFGSSTFEVVEAYNYL